MPRTVDYFFDPMCPYCWVTSRWLRQVIGPRELDVRWRFISLRMLNEGTYDDPDAAYPQGHQRGLEALRVAAALRDAGPDEAAGNEAVGRFYEALGTQIWETAPAELDRHGLIARHVGRHDLGKVLADLGLDTSLADAADDRKWDDVVRAETELALSRAGDDLGTPIISLDPPDGPAFYGPVMSDSPTDVEQAIELWDAFVTVASYGPMRELKTTLGPGPNVPFQRRIDELSA